jgi:cell division protein ZapA
MPKLTVTLYGREYQLACQEGQERRVQELVNVVEQRMRAVASSVGNTTENRLFMLTCMMLADEMMEMRETRDTRRPAQQTAPSPAVSAQEEEYLHDRLEHLTAAVGRA